MTPVRWRDHWLVLLCLVLADAAIFAWSFIAFPPPRSGHVLPVQPLLLLFFAAQIAIATVVFGVVRWCKASSRWWLGLGVLIGNSPLLLIPLSGWLVQRATNHTHDEAALICSGIRIESWRIIPQGETGGPALELHLRPNPGAPGPLYVNFISGSSAAGEPATYMDVSKRATQFETSREIAVAGPLSGIWKPIAYFKFALCQSLQDIHSCAFYAYGVDPAPSYDVMVHCPPLPAPSGLWPPPSIGG